MLDFIGFIALEAVDSFGRWLAKERSQWVQALVGVGCSMLALIAVFGVVVLVAALA